MSNLRLWRSWSGQFAAQKHFWELKFVAEIVNHHFCRLLHALYCCYVPLDTAVLFRMASNPKYFLGLGKYLCKSLLLYKCFFGLGGLGVRSTNLIDFVNRLVNKKTFRTFFHYFWCKLCL